MTRRSGKGIDEPPDAGVIAGARRNPTTVGSYPRERPRASNRRRPDRPLLLRTRYRFPPPRSPPNRDIRRFSADPTTANSRSFLNSLRTRQVPYDEVGDPRGDDQGP